MVAVTKGIKIGIIWRKALASRQTERRWRRCDGRRARERAGTTLGLCVRVCTKYSVVVHSWKALLAAVGRQNHWNGKVVGGARGGRSDEQLRDVPLGDAMTSNGGVQYLKVNKKPEESK